MKIHFPLPFDSLADWPNFVNRIGWMLVHSLWQFALVALMFGIALRFLQRATSAARYAAGLAALSTMVLLPALTWFETAGETAIDARPLSSVGEPPPRLMPLADQNADRAPRRSPAEVESLAASPDAARHALRLAPARSAAPAAAGNPFLWRERLEPSLPTIVWCWLAGVGLFGVRPLLSWRTVRRLRVAQTAAPTGEVGRIFARTVSKLGLRRTVRVMQSGLIHSPAVLGYLRPLVIIPAAVASGFPPDQLEALFAHELAHVRRHDYLVNLLQTTIETLFFYHPAVWWVSAQIRTAREDCCDDIALSICHSQTQYVKTLVALEELRDRAPVTALAAAGGSLLGRIRRISGIRAEPTPALGPLVVASAVLFGVALLGFLSRPAQTADRPALAMEPKAEEQRQTDLAKLVEAAERRRKGVIREKLSRIRGLDPSPFRVNLADGAELDLAVVGELPFKFSPNSQTIWLWWRPDGELVRGQPRETWPTLTAGYITNSMERNILLDIVADSAANVIISTLKDRMASTESSHWEQNLDGNGKIRERRLFTAAFSTDCKETSLTVSYVGGPWNTIASCGANGEAAVSTDGRVKFADPRHARPFLFIDFEDGFRQREEQSVIRAEFHFQKPAGMDKFEEGLLGDVNVRIIAVDRNGREHSKPNRFWATSDWSNRSGPRQVQAMFPGLPLAEIKEFRFQTRPMHRIEFRHIALQPGPKTNFEIVLDGKPFTPQSADGDARP